MIKVIKKDNTVQEFKDEKIINACKQASYRALEKLTDSDYEKIVSAIRCYLKDNNKDCVTVEELHSLVENTLLEHYPKSGEHYRDYRNYKKDFVKITDEVYKKSLQIQFVGDVSNANTDATMVSTQRSLVVGELNKNLYDKFFLNSEERQACNDGYIYIHDKKDRLLSVNCCLFDVENVMSGGFEMGNVWYNEPKTLDVAFDVISDIVISSASQQYGGFTIPEVDKLLKPYAEKSYNIYKAEYETVLIDEDVDILNCETERKAHNYAMKKVKRDFEQGFQAWEMKFNTVGSSRGDYPFISISFGIGQSEFETLASQIILETRKNGQGKKGFKKPVLFPKLTFLYDENLHGSGKSFEWLFDLAIECSSKTMYPDYLSLTGEGYIPSVYKKYGKVISLMGKMIAHIKLGELTNVRCA